MISQKDFGILSLQFSMFTPNISFSINKILGVLMDKFGDVFDEAPISFPIPEDAPKEIPRLILQSSDKRLKLEIAISRVNLFVYWKEDDVMIDVKAFSELCSDIFKEYLNSTSATVGRIALVSLKFAENDNPALTLAKHFCKEEWIVEPLNRPENFELHSHKRYELDTFTINSWVRCKTGALKKDNKPIVLVQQDINTLLEEIEKNEFDIEQIGKFLKLVIEEQNSILKKYFPKR
jgi:hypothetical protein